MAFRSRSIPGPRELDDGDLARRSSRAGHARASKNWPGRVFRDFFLRNLPLFQRKGISRNSGLFPEISVSRNSHENYQNSDIGRGHPNLKFSIKVVPHPCTHFNSACFYLKTKVAISLANQRVRSSNDHHVKDKSHTYLLLSKSFGQNDY